MHKKDHMALNIFIYIIVFENIDHNKKGAKFECNVV